MHRYSRILAGIIGLFMLMTVSGCYSTKADDLYKLPQASQEYLQLQKQIDAVLDSGAEYSPPIAGPNRQSVQLKDLDGDGQSEAIAFFRISGDRPLKVYIMKQTEGTYETVSKIEGNGTAIESIRYVDMDGDNVSELVIGYQSAGLSHMTIYSIRDNQAVLLHESDYSKLVTSDLNEDDKTDVIALRLPTPEVPGGVDMYMLRSDGEIINSSAVLSAGIESINRIYKSELIDGSSAIFVEGSYQTSSIITDILCWQDDGIFNIFADSATDNSEETVRTQEIYSTDINSDGVRDIPSPRLLLSSEDKTYYAIDWYSYDRDGQKHAVFTTYHDFQDDWYLILPEEWKDRITVYREDTVAGERTIVFTWLPERWETVEGESGEDFLKIYTLSGDNKEDRASLSGRYRLLPQQTHGDVIYAYEILKAGESLGVTTAMVGENFRPINKEWTTGVY